MEGRFDGRQGQTVLRETLPHDENGRVDEGIQSPNGETLLSRKTRKVGKEVERGRERCDIPTHSGRVVKDPHAISLYEGFPAQLGVGYVPEAGQQPFANQHVAMPRVVAVPVLVQSQ